MYYLFKYDTNEQEKFSDGNIPYKIDAFKIKMFRLNVPHEKISFKERLLRAYFHMITQGKFWIYYVLSEEKKVIHTSYVVGKCYKFPFMKKGDFEIGPCVTMKEYRGMGIYPSVIKKIIETREADSFYMFCDTKNAASLKGIQKTGFIENGILYRNALKVYVEKQGGSGFGN